MRKPEQKTKRGTGGLRACIGTKVVAAIATFSLVASMCPGTAALAYADDQLTAGSADLEAQSENEKTITTITKLDESRSPYMMRSGTYRVTEDVTITPPAFGNGIEIYENQKVHLIIDEGATLTVTGDDASGWHQPARAAILLPESSTLIISGGGTLNATGGRAGDGANGYSAAAASDDSPRTGKGGDGGGGGGGAGAGIGTDGGGGGFGMDGGEGISSPANTKVNTYGNPGTSGNPGKVAARAGTVIITGTVTVNAKGGAGGAGGKGSSRGKYAEKRNTWNAYAAGTSGGGGAGGGGTAAYGIGSGGSGGGGGGGGASASIDGEAAIFGGADLDDLWGHGGGGGNSAWGGTSGERGDEGGSNGGDANGKYARSGGAGGACTPPKATAFYTYKAPGASTGPTVNCVSGNGVISEATSLDSLAEFKDLPSGLADMVSGGTFTYDGEQHGVAIGGSDTQAKRMHALTAQAEGDEPSEYDEKGETAVDGVSVKYWITYYDASGERVGSVPTMPGRYVAVVSFESDNPEYCGSWVEPIVIAKRQVDKPTPAELVFECADWSTGEGALQDAFPGLDEADYAFATFTNGPDGTSEQGHGIENHFELQEGDGDWHWTAVPATDVVEGQ